MKDKDYNQTGPVWKDNITQSILEQLNASKEKAKAIGLIAVFAILYSIGFTFYCIKNHPAPTNKPVIDTIKVYKHE
jgi:hypothetical protein